MVRKTKEAFTWIINILRKNKIPFQIVGGFAANIYGSKRPLADIDIEIPDKQVLKIKNSVKKYIIYGPKQYKDKEFDLLLMTLKYKGQEIELCGIDSEKLFNKKRGKWEKESINLSKAIRKKVYNHIVPIIPINMLINYKKKIARVVDIKDINALSK